VPDDQLAAARRELLAQPAQDVEPGVVGVHDVPEVEDDAGVAAAVQ
jgi:hypothetical protein